MKFIRRLNIDILSKAIFITSECVLLFAVSAFRTKSVLIFLAIHFLLYTGFLFFKNGKLTYLFDEKKTTIIASFVAIVVFYDFYLNSIKIRPKMLVQISVILQRIIPLSYGAFISLASIGIGFFSLYAIYLYVDIFIRHNEVLVFIFKRYKYHIFALLIIYCSALWAIVRSNYYYIDDIGRTINGNGLTGGFSRYLSDILAEMLHVNVWLADISPVSQIVALIILAYTGGVILYLIHGENPPKLYHILSLIPMGLSPYFLGCISFKYDAPYMAISILVSIYPILFYCKMDWEYIIVVYLSTICMCTTYQASSGIFPVCVVIVVFFMWIEKTEYKTIGIFIGKSVLGYMSGLLSFRYILMAPTTTSYVNTSISFNHIIPNIIGYLNVLNNDYGAVWKLCALIILGVFSGYIIKITLKNRMITMILLIITLMVGLILTYGANIVFEKPTTDARGIYAIGVIIAIISSITMSLDKRCFSVSAIFILSWMCIVFSTIYGNALCLQKEYTAYRIEQVLDEINEQKLIKNQENMELQFLGTEGVSTAVKNLSKEYPLLNRLMPVLFDDTQDYYWGPRQVCGFYESYLDNLKIIYSNDFQLEEYFLVQDTTNYSIYQKSGAILVYFHSMEE